MFLNEYQLDTDSLASGNAGAADLAGSVGQSAERRPARLQDLPLGHVAVGRQGGDGGLLLFVSLSLSFACLDRVVDGFWIDDDDDDDVRWCRRRTRATRCRSWTCSPSTASRSSPSIRPATGRARRPSPSARCRAFPDRPDPSGNLVILLFPFRFYWVGFRFDLLYWLVLALGIG